MKKNKQQGRLLILFIMLNLVICMSAQVNSDANYNHIIANTFQLCEKYYIHTDRKYYAAGENIHFKVYSLFSKKEKPENLSSILYMNLLDSSGSTVIKKKFIVDKNGAYGSFHIPENVFSGYYFLYAYTKLQRNFDFNNYAVKKIFIINPKTGLILSKSKMQNGSEIKFLPQGGIISEGVNNRVGIYGKNEYGEIIQLSGAILNENDSILTSFESSASGMGNFSINPQKQDSLKVMIKYQEDSIIMGIPAIDKYGFSFGMTENNDSIAINFKSEFKHPLFVFKFKMFIEFCGFKYINVNDSLSNNDFVKVFSKKHLMPGLNRVVFTDVANNILYDKFIELDRKEALKISVKSNKKLYSTREKVEVNLNTSVASTQKAANFSVSVSRLENQAKPNNYQSFSSIITKSFYDSKFVEEYESVNINLKNLNDQYSSFLLTSNYLSDTRPKNDFFYPEVRGFYLSGKILNAKTKEPLANTNIYVTVLDSIRTNRIVKTEADGRFQIVFDNMQGSNEVLFQIKDSKSAFEIQIDDDFEKEFPKIDANLHRLPECTKEYLERIIFNYQVNKNFNREIISDSQQGLPLLFYGKPDARFFLADYVDLPNMLEVLVNIVQGVTIKKRMDKQVLSVFDKNTNILKFSPLILIDGIPVFDLNVILDIPPSKVERIEVVNSNYIIGGTVFGGILSVVSKNLDFGGIKLPESSQVAEYELISNLNHKYSDFSQSPVLDKHHPDFRNTVYWNPLVKTDEKGEANFSFYTSDEKGFFIIRVEGISEEGNPGKGYFIYEVK